MRAIFFKAYYCGACDVLWDEICEPLLEEGYSIDEIDAMKEPALARHYGVEKVPTVIVLHGNQVRCRLHGRLSLEELRAALERR